jgi:hypothetical protein
MKKLLFVLLVLGLSIPAYAVHKEEVLIYSFKQKTTEYTCDISGITDMNLVNSLEWEKSVKTSTGYLVVQWAPDSDIELNVWTVLTEKLKDRDGKPYKWASVSGPAEFAIAQATVGNKTTWLVGYNYASEHTLLTGEEKRIKILDKGGSAATKLAGTSTWRYEQDSILHVGSSAISLSWQSKLTAAYFSNPYLVDGFDAVGLLLDYLDSKGYDY